MQVLLDDLTACWWSISVLINPVYWMLFGRASRFEGFGLRFFDTPLRSIVLAETIGIGGTTCNVLLGLETPFTMMFMILFATPMVIISAYFSQGLRKAIIDYQTSKSLNENTSLD